MKTGRLLGFATDYFVKNYPGLSGRVPVINMLSGLLQEEEGSDNSLSGSESQSQQEFHASFTKKRGVETEDNLDEEIKAKLDLMRFRVF